VACKPGVYQNKRCNRNYDTPIEESPFFRLGTHMARVQDVQNWGCKPTRPNPRLSLKYIGFKKKKGKLVLVVTSAVPFYKGEGRRGATVGGTDWWLATEEQWEARGLIMRVHRVWRRQWLRWLFKMESRGGMVMQRRGYEWWLLAALRRLLGGTNDVE